jgi:uncharacterized membrane protein
MYKNICRKICIGGIDFLTYRSKLLLIMNAKTMAIVAYITLIGWIVAFVTYNGDAQKPSLTRFHLRQAFGLLVAGVAFYIVYFILLMILPFLGLLFGLVGIAFLVLWIMGIINAANEQEKPLPLVGEFFDKTFTFIK